MDQHQRDVEIAVKRIAERMKDGPRTLNELRDWYVKELGGPRSAFDDACKYMIKMTVAEGYNIPGGTKMLALAGQRATRPKGSGYVAAGPAPAADRNAKLERAADRPFTKDRLAQVQFGRASAFDAKASAAVVEHGARAGAVPPRPPMRLRGEPGTDFPTQEKPAAAALPPPLPRAPSASRPLPDAPSPASGGKPTLNVGPPAGSNDKTALSTPPARDRSPDRDPDELGASPPAASTHHRYGPPPAPEADGTVWLTHAATALVLGIEPGSVSQTMRRHPDVRRRKHPGRDAEVKAPYFYAEADVQRLAATRAGNPLVHSNRGKEPATSRPELAEHQRQVAEAGRPHVVIPRETLAEAAFALGAEFPKRPPLTDAEVTEAAKAVFGRALRPRDGDLPETETVALSPREPRRGRYVALVLGPAVMELLERLVATGLYAPTPREVAEELLLAELRRHVDMPSRIARGRR